LPIWTDVRPGRARRGYPTERPEARDGPVAGNLRHFAVRWSPRVGTRGAGAPCPGAGRSDQRNIRPAPVRATLAAPASKQPGRSRAASRTPRAGASPPKTPHLAESVLHHRDGPLRFDTPVRAAGRPPEDRPDQRGADRRPVLPRLPAGRASDLPAGRLPDPRAGPPARRREPRLRGGRVARVRPVHPRRLADDLPRVVSRPRLRVVGRQAPGPARRTRGAGAVPRHPLRDPGARPARRAVLVPLL